MPKRLSSPLVGFSGMSAAYQGGPPPPPWPDLGDPRTDACRHDWSLGQWGQPGERQHECDGCGRWIWERLIWPQGAHSGSSGVEQ